ncbi:MAG TPA: hypothetical protein VE988_29465 [Gemmataceae bacterium]|nr:hypothetical protein [Gemmataceae bacterium]
MRRPWFASLVLLLCGAGPSAQLPTLEKAGAQKAQPGALPDPVTVTVEDGGTGPYKAILTGDRSLLTHTLYRPKDLTPFGKDVKLPIVLWGNGGCRNSSGEFREFLSEIASHGFLIVAIGPSSSAATKRGNAPTGQSKSSQLLDGLDWAMAQNGKDGEYKDKLDTKKVAVMGQSCGGVQALEVSLDPRITTSVIWNSGLVRNVNAGQAKMAMPALSRDLLKKLHAPIAYINGGTKDTASKYALADFPEIEKVPVLLASQEVGHYPATFRQPHGGAFAVAGVAWLQWQLKGDQKAAKMFTGDNPGLAADPKWKVERKNIK